MITLYGVTEDGTSVPVQVTADGRVVAQGLEGPASEVPGPPGPQGPPGPYGPGDDVDFGKVRATGRVEGSDFLTSPDQDVYLTGTYQQGGIGDARGAGLLRLTDTGGTQGNQQAIRVTQVGNQPNVATFAVRYDGSVHSDGTASFASDKCGFNSDGELIFTSRGERYRMIIQGNMLYPDPYPVARTQDIVLPDE